MVTYQKRIGEVGENLAAAYLESKGYCILGRNFSSRFGEIDLVADCDDCLVFVEVKTRTTDTFGMPEDSITQSKLTKIESAGLMWLQAHPEITDDWRVDVISILLDSKGELKDLQHFIQANL